MSPSISKPEALPAAHAKSWAIGLAALLFLAVAAAFGFYTVFSRPLSQDEGYLMITLQGYFGGNPLYDSVYTQYGPFYYIYEWVVRTLAQIPLTHDATRLLCVFHWIAAASLLAVAGWRMTRSITGGLLVFMQAVVHLRFLADEPGHPQEIVALLVAAAILASFRKEARAGAFELISLAIAALVFTKINVGVFLGFSLVLALRSHAGGQFARPSQWALGGLCIAVPFLLMHRHVGVTWGRNYAILAACTMAGAFLVACQHSSKLEVNLKRYFRMAAFFIVPGVLFISVPAMTGSSAAGLIDGLLITPLNMSAAAVMPVHTRSYVPMNAMMALFVALLVVSNRNAKHMDRVVGVLKLCYGIAGAFWLVGEPRLQFGYLLPWLWIALASPAAGTPTAGVSTFPRVFLCLAAAAQSLQAYPVAGTQVVVGTMLLVVVYTVCLADAFSTFGAWKKIEALQQNGARRAVVMGSILATAALLYLFANVWCDLPAVRNTYARLPSLDLPGSKLVRLKPGAPEVYQELTRYLAAESDTFISYPCMNSFYFWSGKQPPTLRNGTVWTQFTHAQQREILAALSKAPRPKLVLVPEFTRNLEQFGQRRELIEPLFEYAAQCEPIKQIGPYVIFVPKRLTGMSAPP